MLVFVGHRHNLCRFFTLKIKRIVAFPLLSLQLHHKELSLHARFKVEVTPMTLSGHIDHLS